MKKIAKHIYVIATLLCLSLFNNSLWAQTNQMDVETSENALDQTQLDQNEAALQRIMDQMNQQNLHQTDMNQYPTQIDISNYLEREERRKNIFYIIQNNPSLWGPLAMLFGLSLRLFLSGKNKQDQDKDQDKDDSDKQS